MHRQQGRLQGAGGGTAGAAGLKEREREIVLLVERLRSASFAGARREALGAIKVRVCACQLHRCRQWQRAWPRNGCNERMAMESGLVSRLLPVHLVYALGFPFAVGIPLDLMFGLLTT